MGLSRNYSPALLFIGALMGPVSAIYAEIISVTPHTACSSVAPMDIAKPSIDRLEVAPIPAARIEIASVEVAGKERAEANTLKQGPDTGSPQTPISLPCPSPAPIGVRYAPDLR